MPNAIADSATECGISWNGFNLHGDARSIGEVRRLLNVEGRLAWFERAYGEILGAGCPCKARKRPGLADDLAEQIAVEGIRKCVPSRPAGRE